MSELIFVGRTIMPLETQDTVYPIATLLLVTIYNSVKIVKTSLTLSRRSSHCPVLPAILACTLFDTLIAVPLAWFQDIAAIRTGPGFDLVNRPFIHTQHPFPGGNDENDIPVVTTIGGYALFAEQTPLIFVVVGTTLSDLYRGGRIPIPVNAFDEPFHAPPPEFA